MPPGVFVRRTEFDDQVAIQAMIGEDAAQIARRFSLPEVSEGNQLGVVVTNMIETASLGITAVDDKGQVVGYAAFYDHPTFNQDVDAAKWPDWFHLNFGHTEYQAANTAWLCFFVADHLVQNDVAESILRTAFTTLSEIDVLLLAQPEDVRPFAPLRDAFEPLQALSGSAGCRVLACHRGLYVPDLLIREARVEDHDDLVPVFNAQSEILTERYGEFFIADLIDQQDERNTALVAEVDGHAIGLLALSADIDIALLQKTFDLAPYDNLQRIDHEARARFAAQREALRAERIAQSAARQAAQVAEGEIVQSGSDEEPSAESGLSKGDASENGDIGGDSDHAADGEHGGKPGPVTRMATPTADEDQMALPMLINAFCVSVFCMDESFESRSVDFLHAAFACFPKCDYAILTLPHTTPEFSLVNAFTQVEPLPSSSFSHLLYVFHRDALGGTRSLAVRPASVVDVKMLLPLIESVVSSNVNDVFAALEAATGLLPAGAERTKAAYIAECVGHPVGVVILDNNLDVTDLQARYALEDFVLFSEHPHNAHAILHTSVLSPIFARNARWVLKEVFRQHKCACLYIKLRQGDPIPTVLTEFVQSKPRKLVEHCPGMLAELDAQRKQLELPPRPRAIADGSLYFLTRKLLSEPKIVNNTRIVISGTSDTALALLEALISVPYLHFSYIYLVAPLAASRLREPRGHLLDKTDPSCPAPFFARNGGYTREELRALGLGARVHLVDSALADIDRSAKAIVLPDGSILPYDYLVIAPEFGDQTLVNLPEGGFLPETRGAFSLFDESCMRAASAFLESTFNPRSDRALVYGGSIDAFATVQALLTRGVPAGAIVHVAPPLINGVEETFADPRIHQKVLAKLASLGVQTLDGMRMVGIQRGPDCNVKSVTFETEGGSMTTQQCNLLLCAGSKQVQRSTFEALNGNSLVYDGGLVVDTHFCTNDKSIYAAGEITKLSRRYRSKLSMGSVSARECGAKLAQALLPVLDPLSASTANEDGAVPNFEMPKITCALLPGPLHYVSIAQPVAGCETCVKIREHSSYGRELINEVSPDSFCSVRLDKSGVIRAISYLGPDPVEEGNWACLIGLPEAVLNNLAQRFDEGILPDLPKFFRENWSIALYHDRFGEFMNALRAELETDDTFKLALDKLRDSADYDAGKLNPVHFMNLLPDSRRNLVRARLLDYVAGNQNHLDMYLVPTSAVMKRMEESRLR